MLRYLPIFICFLFNFAKAQESWNTLQITELKPGYFIYTSYQLLGDQPFPSNGMYVVGDSAVLLIDTPWNEAQFQPLLDSIEKRHHKPVVFCLSTHFHADRTAGLGYFAGKGIATWSSKHTQRLCIERNEQKAAHTFKKDTVFTVAGVKFETFYPGHGHSPDNIVVYFPGAKVFYGGCFVKSCENTSLGNMADANKKRWIKAVWKAKGKFPEAEEIIPGHFSWTKECNALVHTSLLLKGW